jgi:hypothetical protein
MLKRRYGTGIVSALIRYHPVGGLRGVKVSILRELTQGLLLGLS